MSGGDDRYFGEIPGITVILFMLCGLGVASNLVVIIHVVVNKVKKLSTDFFILNLAVSDILIAGLSLPMRIINSQNIHDNFKGGDFICKSMMFTPMVSVSASVVTMVVISIDRYKNIVKRINLEKRHTFVCVIVIWILAIVLGSPTIYEYNVYEKPDPEYENVTILSCGSKGIVANFETVYASIIVTFVYIIPVSAMVVSYTLILMFVWKSSKHFATDTRTGNGQIFKKRNRILAMLITITAVFSILWAPFFVIFAIEEVLDLDDSSMTSTWPHITKQIMVAFSTISNPVLYVIFDGNFRNGLKKFFCCKRPNRIIPMDTVKTDDS